MKKKVSFTAFLALVFISVTVALIFTVASLTAKPLKTATESTSSTESVSHSVEATLEEKNKSSGITDAEVLVSCIAINDPKAFKSIKKADITQLMGIALWCVLESRNGESYDFTDKQMIIAEGEVDAMFYSLFTDSVSPRHGTVKNSGITFSYDESKKVYCVPITGVTPAYTGQIVKQKQKGNTITLKVDYIPESNWVQDSKGNIVPPEKEKTVYIALKQNSDKTLTLCSVSY